MPLRASHTSRRDAFGHINRSTPRKLVAFTKAMASGDAEGSTQGRPLREALEFNKPQSEASASQQSSPASAEPQATIKAGDMLGDKYKVLEVLGRGKAGVTYKAERPGGGTVAIKALSLRTMADWKQLELFEKEADALRSLSHPGIPAYKDYFEVDSDGDRAYFLVQELVEGKSLAQMVEAGWKPAHKEVERIADELLSTFSYLQKQQVVHRDVKPENIILEGGKPGGRVFLVDFGGVQQGNKDVVDSEVVDTGTLVGTYGYMAPEQLRGSARPASDLFALGGTLLYLLSGEPPSSFPQRRLKVDFSRVDVTPRLKNLLEGLLQPAYEDRLTTTQAKAVLAGQAPFSQQQQRQQQKGWGPFSQGGWEDARQRSKTSSNHSDRQASSGDQEAASISGRQSEPQGVGFNNVLLALAAAYVLPGPLFPLVALTLPFWLSGKSRRRSRSSSASSSGTASSSADSPDSDWMSGTGRQQQGGFGFSDGPAESGDTGRSESEADLSPEEQEASRRLRRQQQQAAFQQQQMLFNMMRLVGGGMIGGYRGGPFGMRGGFRRGPFMF